MTLRRAFVVGSFVGVAAIPAYLAPITQSATQAPGACTVFLSGNEEPNMLPASNVWEAAFKAQRSAPRGATAAALPISPVLRSGLDARAAGALDKLAALRQTLPPGAGNPRQAAMDREQVIAETITDARDEAARRASPDDFEALLELAETTARSLIVEIPTLGRLNESDDGQPTCEVSILGRDYPHLVPEYQMWSSSFSIWARASVHNRGADGRITDQYVTLAQRSGLHAEPDDVRKFLNVAEQVDADVKLLRATPSGDAREQALSRELQLQRTVMRGRHRLMLAVSIEGWRAIVENVEATREGTKLWFRSRPNI